MLADKVPGPLHEACPQTRPGHQEDAVAGVVPAFVAAPASVDEAAGTLRAAAALGLAVLPRGTGTKLAWGAPPDRCDLVVDTRGMNRVLEHAAGDLVVSVQAGVELDSLAGVLAAAGQRLALDPPGAGTVGGVLAAGAAGPLRLRYGAPRDLVIGITVVRADGTVASSGGKVVKNVAGYDLGKLFAGSHGTLGLIAEATFRLHPQPAAARYLTLDCPDPAAAHAVMAAAADSPLAPSAAEIDRPAPGTPIRAGILLEGDPDGVAERATRMRALLGSDLPVTVSPTRPAWWGRGAAVAAGGAAGGSGGSSPRGGTAGGSGGSSPRGGTVVRIGFWAAQLADVLAAVDQAAQTAGLDPAVSGSAAAGVIYAAVAEEAAPAAAADFVTALRAALPGQPGAVPPARSSVVVLRAPASVHGLVDLWGPVPSLGLMRAVKDQFDPGHRMAPGRFAGGI